MNQYENSDNTAGAATPAASCSAYHVRLIAYRLAAWIIGGTVHQFEGRDRAGRWHRGLCILSHDALDAHKVCFRHDASVYMDTALVEPNVQGQTTASTKL